MGSPSQDRSIEAQDSRFWAGEPAEHRQSGDQAKLPPQLQPAVRAAAEEVVLVKLVVGGAGCAGVEVDIGEAEANR